MVAPGLEFYDPVTDVASTTTSPWSSRAVQPDDVIVFVGSQESPKLLLLMMETGGVCNSVLVVDPDSGAVVPTTRSTEVTRRLQKRFGLVQKARLASAVGIVVGTLSAARYAAVIRQLRDAIRRGGMQCYTFIVGKISVEKLANFGEIDVFVMVACREASLVDSTEYHKPLVTPFEMMIALDAGFSWSGRAVLDFSAVLTPEAEEGSKDAAAVGSDSDDDAPVFSPVLGTYVARRTLASKGSGAPGSTSRPDLSEDAASNALVVTDTSDGTVAVRFESAAAAFLRQRAYQGLDPLLAPGASTDIVEGRVGIASGYKQEGSDQ